MTTYLIKSGDSFTIGKTKNLKKRLVAYRTHNPDIQLLWSIDLDIESYLHYKFKDVRLDNREWFNLDYFDINSIISIPEDITSEDFNLVKTESKRSSYTKITNDKKTRVFIFNLKPCTRSLYFWLLMCNNNSKFISIDRSKYMKESNTSLNTFKKAVSELLNIGILYSTKDKSLFKKNPFYL